MGSTITEAKVYDALGIAPPDDSGQPAQAQAAANPAGQSVQNETFAAEEGSEGGQAQELADPATVNTDHTDGTDGQADAATADPEEPEDSGDSGANGEKQPLTAEQRRANAARRREQEERSRTQAAVDGALQAEREKTDARLKAFFEQAGMKDTFTGKQITSIEEFDAWQAKFKDQQIEKDLQAGKLSREALEAVVANHPVLKRAEQIVQQGEQAQKAAQQEADRTRMNAQIEQISKIDPMVKEAGDLLKLPEAKALYDYVRRGYALEDAHALATRQRLEGSRIDAARQQAMNNTRGKDHLQSSGNARGAGAISVPPEVKKMYKLMNPSASEAEIQAHFNNYMKQGG